MLKAALTAMEMRIMNTMDVKMDAINVKLDAVNVTMDRLNAKIKTSMDESDVKLKAVIESSAADIMTFVGASVNNVANTLKQFMAQQTAAMSVAPARYSTMSLLPRAPPSTSALRQAHVSVAVRDAVKRYENHNAAELIGLDPLKKIASIEIMQKFDAHIVQEEIASVYVSIAIHIPHFHFLIMFFVFPTHRHRSWQHLSKDQKNSRSMK